MSKIKICEENCEKNNIKLSLFNKISKIFCNLLFPKGIKCLLCGRDLSKVQEIEFCENCFKKLSNFRVKKLCLKCGDEINGDGNFCLVCKGKPRNFEMARSIFKYEGEVRKLIVKFKFNNCPYMSETFGALLANYYKETDWEIDAVVCAPMSIKRKRKRGYNQAELLAKSFCEKTGLKFLDILIKAKDTSQQSKLSYSERQTNLQKSIRIVNDVDLTNKNILFIDDIFTTGATADICSLILKNKNVKKVYVLTLAHTPLQIPTEKGFLSK